MVVVLLSFLDLKNATFELSRKKVKRSCFFRLNLMGVSVLTAQGELHPFKSVS